MLITDLGSIIQFPQLVVGDLASLATAIANVDLFERSLLGFEFVSPGEEIFQLGWFRLKWYGLLIAAAVLIGVNLSIWLGKYRKIDAELIADLAICLVLGAIPAARIYYVIFEWRNYAQHPENIIKIWEGGIAIHGALIGGSIAAIMFAKFKQVSFWQLADIVAPSVILGQAIGRWGNFFNSEAFGSQTDLPWKLCIRNYQSVCDYVHPTFLYESLWNLLVFLMLIWLFFDNNQHHRLKSGSIFLIYLVSYSIGRFAIEGLRTDSLMFGSLRMAQMISLTGISIGLIGLGWLYVRRKSLPDVV